MKNRLSRDPGVTDPSAQPRAVQSAGVLGTGLMGAGIATAHARSGIRTAMVDVDDASVQDGLQRASDVVMSRIKIGRATPQDMAQHAGDAQHVDPPAIFADSDIVIEAITENEAAKKEAYQKLAKVMRDDAILASNTSTISITRLAESAPDPERFVGMHFFNPVDRMELVEVIRGEKTSDETVATIVALAKRIRKTPIVVKDCAGFLVNRVLFPYMNESLVLLAGGRADGGDRQGGDEVRHADGPDRLDRPRRAWRRPCYAGKVVLAAYPDRAVTSPILVEMLKAGGRREVGG